jgi:hypothetical protein
MIAEQMRAGRLLIAAVLFGASIHPRASSAQLPDETARDSTLSLSLGMRGWTAVGGPVQGPALGVSLRTQLWRLRLNADGGATTVARAAQGYVAPYLLDGRVSVTTAPFQMGRAGADASIGMERDAFDPRATWIQQGASVRAWYGTASQGVWAQAGAHAPFDIHATPTSMDEQAGAWWLRGGTELSASLRRIETGRLAATGADSSTIDPATCHLDYDPNRVIQQYRTVCPERLAAVDAGVAVAWNIRGARVRLFAASRLLGQPSLAVARENWFGGSVELGWSESMRFTLEADRRPTDIVRGLPANQRFSVGIRFLPWAERAPPGDRDTGDRDDGARASANAAALQLGDAGTADVRGDFTNWLPVRLTRGRNGRWLLPRGIAPGVYMLSVRLDGGEWHAPPGLPSTADGFGGIVGILVIE